MFANSLVLHPFSSGVTEKIPHVTPYFFSKKENRDLVRLLERPYQLFIEQSHERDLNDMVEKLIIEKPHITLSLTTASCFHNNAALALANALNQRFGLDEFKCLTISTCLQEAIMNAMLHGNLEVESNFTDIESFEQFQATIQERLKIDHYRLRRIHLRVWRRDDSIRISVSDEGKGILVYGQPTMNKPVPHGRGFLLMQSLCDQMWVDRDPRTLCMNFHF